MSLFTKSKYPFKTHWLSYISFCSCPIIYFLALAIALYLTFGIPWVWASLLIGMIFIGTSIIAFHEKHFDEYMEKGEKASPFKLLTSIMLWSLLNFTIQIFILLGFWMTVDAPRLNENIYIYPCYYGQIYKHTDSLLNQMDSQLDARLLEDTAELDAYRTKRNTFLISYCSPHLKPLKENDLIIEREPIDIEEEIYKIPFYVAIAFGFLGALIYTLIDIRKRVASKDLEISCTARYLIRFIVAPTLCIVVAYFISSDWWTQFAPLAFFCIGYFPDEALQWMKNKYLLGLQEGKAGAKVQEQG